MSCLADLWSRGDFPPRRWHLLLAGVCVAVIYLVGVTGKWWPAPDSALYLGLARSLANGEGYRFNGSPCNMVTPGLPAILAGLRMLFGPGFGAPNLFMALCGLGSLVLIYLSVARLSDKRTALAVALATGLSYTYFFNCHRILTDAPFAALFWAILYAYIRYRSGSVRWLILAGLLSVAAVAVRAPGILFLGALAISIMPDRPPGARARKGLIPACVILAILVVLGTGFFIVARYTSTEEQIYARAIMSKVNADPMVHLRNIGMGLRQLPLTVSEMFTSQETYFAGLPALGLIGIGGAGLWRRRQRFILPAIVMSVLALALYGSGHMVRPRYLMPIQPLLLLAMIEGLCWCIKRLRRQAKPVVYMRAVAVLVGVIIACNTPKLLRNAVYYSHLSHTPRYYQVVRGGGFAELFEVAEILGENHSDSRSERSRTDGHLAATDCGKVSVLHYLSERTVISLPPIPRNRPAQTKKVYDFILSRTDLKFIILKNSRTKELLENAPGFKLRHNGKRYRVYERK
ncbi:MAG: glycosyltransferase family 39 protein [Phycisphaerae bacterium]|nr:glycosyltransferase family 39 protein [Phycisphaerae bacterium]